MNGAQESLRGQGREECLTILVLEDDDVDRMAIERLVERDGLPWKLRCAKTVAEGIRQVGEGALDLAVLDHKLPDGTAFDLVDRLGETPYIFITGSRDAAVAIEAMKRGAADFLLKDTEGSYVELLPSVVRAALEMSWLRRDAERHHEELERRVVDRTRELERSEARLRALASRLAFAREEERRLVAGEIHDDLGHALTALRMDLSLLRGEWAGREDAFAERLASCIDTVDQSIELVRGVSGRLSPPILEILGLAPALAALVDEHRGRTSARFRVDLAETGPRLAMPVALSLYRIAQEALSNVLRHADAENITVSLRSEGNEHVLEIRDDGGGIPAATLSSSISSMGLLGMRERALEMQGTFEIECPEGGGTCIRVRVRAAADAAPGGLP